MSSFEMLNEKVRRWVWLQGWSALKEIQENAIPPIITADHDVILAAPTAGGKTEAAYLPMLSNILDNPVADGYAILNLSPLKALINDQGQRLEAMTADMDINVTAWHGDISAHTKSRSAKRPSGILLITPESLEGIMVNRSNIIADAFTNLRYVVIDELHSFMGSERGVQVLSLLARIESIIGRPIPRIALSATLSDCHQAFDFLRPAGKPFPFAFPQAGSQGHDTFVLIKEFTSNDDIEYDDATAADIFKHLRGSNNLVFTNSRKEAEALTLKLKDLSNDRGVPNEFHLHHGSLAKSQRLETENSLKNGFLPITAICTSTLEMGIDIGQVKSIAQIVSANSVISLRQRLGRSGRRGDPSILRIYSRDEQRNDYKYFLRTNLIQNIAVIELLSRSIYEDYNSQAPHYSTLIQQLLSITAQYGSFYVDQAWELLCANGAFSNVTADDYLTLLKSLGTHNVLAQLANGQIVIGAEGEKLLRQRDFYTAFVTLKDFSIYDQNTDQTVGVVQYKPYVGEYILLNAQRWLVESINDRTGTVSVSAAHTTGKMMFEGYGQEIDGLITNMMRHIYQSDTQYPYLDENTGAVSALAQAREYYHSLDLANNPMVDIDGRKLLFTWGGMRLNRTLALMRKADGFELPQFDPYAITDIPSEYLDRFVNDTPDLVALSQQVPKYRKLNQKYDYLLPPSLLDKQYAATSLTTKLHHLSQIT